MQKFGRTYSAYDAVASLEIPGEANDPLSNIRRR
jgi:hypothetical protein